MEDRIKEMVQKEIPFLVETRRHLHMHPELSCKEYETAAYIREKLTEWGVPFETNDVANTVAIIKGDLPGKTIAIRGDIDALPIVEETGVEYASVNEGVMHACGHDVHGTFMLGAVKILKDLKKELRGTVKVIFQEGEEIGAGATRLMASHLLDDVDTIAGIHSTQEYDLGKFAIGYGVRSTYGVYKKITLRRGEGSQNLLVVAAKIVEIINGNIDALFPKKGQVVLVPTICTTKTDGQGPSEVFLFYNFRTLSRPNVEILNHIFETLPPAISGLFGVEVELGNEGPDEAVVNDDGCVDKAIEIIKTYFGEENLMITGPRMGGEDFSYYQKEIPGVFLYLGGAINENYLPLHTSKTMVDERILPIGVEFFLRYILEEKKC